MNYPTHDTDWAVSSKGTIWKRTDGIVLSVGVKKNGCYWARRGTEFIKGNFPSKSEAKLAAENEQNGKNNSLYDFGAYWDTL